MRTRAFARFSARSDARLLVSVSPPLCTGYRLRVDSALPHATQPQRAAFVSSFATSPHFLKLQERRSSAGMHLERLSNSGASRRPSGRRLSYVSPYRNSSNSVLPYSEPEKG